jgi:hypothetical protein
VPRRCVVVRDTARAIANAVQAGFGSYRHPRGHPPRPGRPYSVPTDLADLITAVLGLEDRPLAETRQLWQGETSVGPRSARIAKDETT